MLISYILGFRGLIWILWHKYVGAVNVCFIMSFAIDIYNIKFCNFIIERINV